MASVKWNTTKTPGIYQYETQKGVRYGVRIPYRQSDGRRKEFTKSGFKTLNEAKAKKKEFEQETTTQIENKNITLDEWFVKFLKIKNYDKDSEMYSKINLCYKNIIGPEFGHLRLIDLDRASYQIFINKLLKKNTMHGKPYRLNSVKTYHKMFMTILNEAEECEIINKNKLRKTKIAKNEEVQKKHLEPEEFQKFMKTATETLENNFLCMIHLLAWGLRRGEMLGLTQDNIEFISKDRAKINIKITRTPLSKNGKGTKTKGSERKIEIVGEAVELLRSEINRSRELYLKNGKSMSKNDFIFVNNKAIPFHTFTINHVMNEVAKTCGIKVTPHMLRHTFVTLTMLGGGSMTDISKFVGHSTTNMTQVYTHSTETGIQKVVDIASKFSYK